MQTRLLALDTCSLTTSFRFFSLSITCNLYFYIHSSNSLHVGNFFFRLRAATSPIARDPRLTGIAVKQLAIPWVWFEPGVAWHLGCMRPLSFSPFQLHGVNAARSSRELSARAQSSSNTIFLIQYQFSLHTIALARIPLC